MILHTKSFEIKKVGIKFTCFYDKYHILYFSVFENNVLI